MMKDKTLKIDTIHQFNTCFGCKTVHPFVSIIDLAKACLTDQPIEFNGYTLLVQEGECTDFSYGRTHFDYSKATVLFSAPGQVMKVDKKTSLNACLFACHPNLIHRTMLGMNVDRYTFFSYYSHEALHLSLRENLKVTECLTLIEEELKQDIDRHSQRIISKYIELFLDHIVRFYERQFITRNEMNNNILKNMDCLLDEYILSGKLKNKGNPSVAYCSYELNLSPAYFNDLLSFETGKTLEEYFQWMQIETAKKMLLRDSEVPQIVDLLGYPNTQYFNSLFRKITGVDPNEFRMTKSEPSSL